MEPISVVIPAYQEEEGVGAVVRELRRFMRAEGIAGEILVVDDGSTDGTAQAALEAGARVLRHRSNHGYGAALKTGIAAARHDVVAILDADATYPIEALPEMLRRLERADMVVGARVGRNVHIPLARRPAKWVLNRLANYVSGARIPDLNSGLRVFRRDVVAQYFPILPDQFSWTTTLTLAMHCDNYAVAYVPIEYRPRKGRSKIVPWDAGSFLVLILRMAMLFRPLRVFLPLVVICLLYGIVKMSIDLSRDPNISASALLALMSALLLLLIGMLADALAMRLGKLNANLVTGVESRPVEHLESPARHDSGAR
ncbi:MAG: glycosyltransferase family 2 protein [Bryobacteraceae bacterium]|nr:glycosyltransferase family 2 protein [Bryobacteraceae bacterium]